MAGRFSAFVLDAYIAPDVSSFTSATIPDMAGYDSRSGHWVANHFLNSVLRGRFEHPISAFVHNYMRRAEGAFSSHATARSESLRFIELEGQAPGVYARALSHWEIFLTNAWQAEALLAKLIESSTAMPNLVFTKGEGSVEERLNNIYNAIKHAESRIAAGQIVEGALVPVWMTTEGLRSTDAVLTWSETGELLEEIAQWANIFVDPVDARNKLQQRAPTDPDPAGPTD